MLSEVAGLGAEGGGFKACRLGSGGEPGKVDVAGDIDLTWSLQWVIGFLMLVISLQCARAAVRVVVVVCVVTVVDGDKKPLGERR